MTKHNIYEIGLDKTPANFESLSPLSFLERAASVYPDFPATVHGNFHRSWAETEKRCRQIASALQKQGVGEGDTVSVIAPNLPEVFEMHFGVPMSGAVLNTINTRLMRMPWLLFSNMPKAKWWLSIRNSHLSSKKH